MLQIYPIPSPKIITEKDDLKKIILKIFAKNHLQNKDILVITSKIVAVTQGRIRKVKNQKDFEALVEKEADQILGGKQVTLTLKNNIFIAWAGIDRSNIKKGKVVLWPEKPYEVAESLRKFLKKTFKIKELGILITDSCCAPLRQGVSGVALGYSGFEGLHDMRGQSDLYGNILKVTKQAKADNLATAANLVMGEGSERTPFAVIRNAPVKFTNQKISKDNLSMKPEKCIFAPLYGNINKI